MKSPPEKFPAPEYDPRLPEDRRRRVLPPPPPPPLAEEETVKEVLSETAKPSSVPKIRDEVEEKVKKPPIYISSGDAASDLSEICSLSESISATTMRGEDEEEVGMRFKETASPAKFQRRRPVSGRRDLAGRSPSKRSEFSPARRMPVNRPWIPAGSNGVRRDLGENSGRRSPSPARRTDLTRNDLSRTASARRTGRSPRRVPAEEDGRKVEERAEGNESLENPLVSLECFIFL